MDPALQSEFNRAQKKRHNSRANVLSKRLSRFSRPSVFGRAKSARTSKAPSQPRIFNVSPEENSCWLPRIMGLSVYSFVKEAERLASSLSLSHLPPLPANLAPIKSADAFRLIWQKQLDSGKPSLRKAIWKLIRWQLSKTLLMGWTSTLLLIALPLLAGQVVRAVEGKLTNLEMTLVVVTTFFATFFASALMQHGFLSQARAAIKTWGAMTTVVLEHPARMTSAERAGFSEGEVLNLLTTDCQTLIDVMLFMGLFLVMPLQIIVCTILLLYLLGRSFLVGLAILVINVWISERLGDQVKKLQTKKNSLSDKRSLLLNEGLQGIRTVKLYNWEGFVLKRVTDQRKLEIDRLKTMGLYRGWQAFLTLGLPTIAMVATFTVYQFLEDELSAQTVFMSVGLFEFLNMGMAIMPNSVNELRRMLTSIDRISEFLRAKATYHRDTSKNIGIVRISDDSEFFWESLDVRATQRNKKRKYLPWRGKKGTTEQHSTQAIIELSEQRSNTKPDSGRTPQRVVDIIADMATRSSTSSEAGMSDPVPTQPAPHVSSQSAPSRKGDKGFMLRSVGMTAQPGQLIAVVGRVGSGKSSFAQSLLGMTGVAKGEVEIGGVSAYVPQQAFIMNDTVRNNILFGSDFDETLYRAVVASCALELDLAMLPAGDASEVGEKGITISGGQKQRVAIARAAYAQPDVCILDDPLSAMDAHVGRKVFENCVKAGPLKSSTRILITNQLQFCSECDMIYVLKNGSIVERGTHDELMAQKGEYRVLAQHVVGGQNEDSVEDEQVRKASLALSEEETKDLLDSVTGTHGVSAAAESAEVVVHLKEETEGEEKKKKKEDKDGVIMTVEQKSKGRVGIKTFLRLCRASRSVGAGYTVAFLVILCPIAQYLVNFFLARWTDNSEEGTGSIYFILYLATAFGFAVSAGARSVIFNYFFIKASENLHNSMLRQVLGAPMWFFDTTPIGRILNRFGGDTMQLDMLFPRLFEIWAFLGGLAFVIIAVAGIIVPFVIPISLVLIGVAVYLYMRVGAIVLDLRRILMMSYSPIAAFFSGYIYGLDSIRAFGRVDMFAEKFRKLQSGPVTALFYQSSVQNFASANILSFAVALFMTLLSLLLILLRDTEFVTPGFAGLILSYSTLLAVRVPAVWLISTMLEQIMSAVQRIIEYMDLPQEGAGVLEGGEEPAMLLESWPSQGALTLNDVSMSYRPGLPLVLRGVSVTIQAGEKVGVVGRTGAGKSSLVQALFRMVELQSGSIVIDGLDIATVPLGALRGRLGMIPQDPFLFSGTIRTNLDIADAFTDDEIWEALRMVNLDETVRGYSSGLSHEVKEKGENFSVGTVQLLCLARVLLKKPRVIVMDEATASVDLETDSIVQETIRKSFAHCTILTIAHRVNTVIDYDKILVMDQGRVAEFGTPVELLRNTSGVFHDLVAHTGEASAKELHSRAKR